MHSTQTLSLPLLVPSSSIIATRSHPSIIPVDHPDFSMDCGIDATQYSVSYTSIDNILKFGLMYDEATKIDLKSAYMSSHCAESTAERAWIGHSSLFGGSFLVILVHSGNDNNNDNQFEQCSSRACSFSRSVRKF